MPKFIEQILEMYELRQEFMGFEEEIPDFPDEEPNPNIEDAYVPKNIVSEAR